MSWIGAAILDAKHAEVATIPRRIVAPAIGEPQHRHRKLGRVFQHQQKILFGIARKRGPARSIVFGLDQRDKILAAIFGAIDGKVHRATIAIR